MKVLHAKHSIVYISALVSLIAVLATALFLPWANARASSNSPLVGQTVQMPQLNTSCPADGTARPAVMKPLRLGQHQNIVYVYNEIPLNTSTAFGHLKRYDVTTNQKTVIVTSGLSIEHAQVSADGQWILFLSNPDPRGDPKHEAYLQLVRMDGQGLQTLYCIPAVASTFPHPLKTNVQWSTDEKTILISTDMGGTSIITQLDVATGTLRTQLKISDQQLYAYTLLTWLDTKLAYVLRVGLQGPPPPDVLYLLDTTKSNNPNGSDLQKVLEHPVRFGLLSMDSSYNGEKLFVDFCFMQVNLDTTITVQPAKGGTPQTIYHQSPTVCVETLRSVTRTTLLLLVETIDKSGTHHFEEWTMKPDGTNRTVLFDIPKATSTTYNMNVFTQFPWSNLSRDNTMYAFQTFNQDTQFQTMFIAPLKGGAPFQFSFTTRGSIDLVGWTTM